MSDYYHLNVSRIGTRARFRELPKVDPYGNGLPLAMDSQIEADGRRWTLDGLAVGPTLSPEDLQAMYDECDGDECMTVCVDDNGEMGDGLWIEFAPVSRAGTPETNPHRWGDNEGAKNPRPLFAVRLTPVNARLLGEALLSAARMRDAQGSMGD